MVPIVICSMMSLLPRSGAWPSAVTTQMQYEYLAHEGHFPRGISRISEYPLQLLHAVLMMLSSWRVARLSFHEITLDAFHCHLTRERGILHGLMYKMNFACLPSACSVTVRRRGGHCSG